MTPDPQFNNRFANLRVKPEPPGWIVVAVIFALIAVAGLAGYYGTLLAAAL